MGRAHGFRVYLVEAFNNRVKGNEPQSVADGSDAQSEILDLLEGLEGTHFIHPRPPRDGEPERPTRTITINKLSAVRRDLQHLVVAMGEQGSHGRAVHETQGFVDIKDRSPEADHFMTILFPENEGTTFVVVAHTIRMRDPLQLLLRLATQESLRRKKQATTDEETERARAKELGETVPKKQKHDRLVFRSRQAVDSRYLEDIIGSASSATAVFHSYAPSDRGAQPERLRRALRISLIEKNEIEAAQGAARGWISAFRKGAPKTRADGVSELAEALEDEDLLDDGESDRYANAAVSVRGEEDASTRIAVDTIRDVFTYGVSDVAPLPYTYYDRVAARLPGILADEGVDVVPLEALEVTRWLDASTSPPSSVESVTV